MSDLIFQATEMLHIPNDSLGPDADSDITFSKKIGKLGRFTLESAVSNFPAKI